MSKTHKVSVVLALAVLTALGVSLIRKWPPLASAAERAQFLERAPAQAGDTLFFIGDPQASILQMAVSEPRQLAEQTTSAAIESIPIDATMCDIFGLHDSPNGRWIAVDVGCEARSHTLLLEIATGQTHPAEPRPWRESFFLNWAPDGDSFVLRVDPIGDDIILLVNAGNGQFERMDTSPFTVGELVLADRNGQNGRVVALADAGHGYPPVWSPDGTQVAFVMRENAEDSAADVIAPYLESNIYLADMATGDVQAVTQFEGVLTDGAAWSPDGAWLVFSSDADGMADIWLAEVSSGEVQQVTQSVNARYPVWGGWRKTIGGEMKSAKILAIVALASVLALTACDLRPAATSVLPTPVSVIPTAVLYPTLTCTPTPSLTWTVTATPIPTQVPTTIPTAQTIPIPTYDPSIFDVWVEAPLFCSPPQLAAQLWFESTKWELKDTAPPPHQMLVHREILNCHISQSNCGHGLGPDCSAEHDFFYGYSIYGSFKTWITCQGELRYINYCMGGEGDFDVCFAVGCHIEDEIERTTCIQDAENVLRTLQPVSNPLHSTLSPVEGESDER